MRILLLKSLLLCTNYPSFLPILCGILLFLPWNPFCFCRGFLCVYSFFLFVFAVDLFLLWMPLCIFLLLFCFCCEFLCVYFFLLFVFLFSPLFLQFSPTKSEKRGSFFGKSPSFFGKSPSFFGKSLSFFGKSLSFFGGYSLTSSV